MASLKFQILIKIDSLKMFGVAKKGEKANQRQADLLVGNKPNPLRTFGIHSHSTCDTYKRHALDFATWERKEHSEKEFKNLETIPQKHVGEWLQVSIDKGESGYTTRLKGAAMAKIMGCNSNSFGVKLPSKNMDVITRSRNVVAYDKHFSIKNNVEVVDFCKATGLRRFELEQLKPEQICYDKKGDLVLDFRSQKEYKNMTKGGRGRIVHPIRENWNVVISAKEKAEVMGQEHVFNKVNHAMDVHSYRSIYAVSKYEEAIQDLKDSGQIIKNDYICRDGSGRTYCKIALSITSENLGHTRLEIVVKNYLDR